MSSSGPNGAGKTSLLRACAGLLAGHLGRGGRARAATCGDDRTAVRRRVGLLGHAAPLYDELTAAENVRFAVRAAGLPVDRADPALERLGLVGRLRRTAGRAACRPASAGGWRWPCWWPGPPSCGCSTSRTPGSTPPPARLLAELVAEAAAGGAAVLLSSHEPDLAVPLADRVVTHVRRPGGRGAPRAVGARSLGAVAPGDADVA